MEKKDHIAARFLRLFITDAAHVGWFISSRDLPGRINSPADTGPWIFPRLVHSLSGRNVLIPCAIVKLIDPLH